jgi:hypothetical protein
MKCAIEMASGDKIFTKFEDWFWYSGNVQVITATI